MGDRDMAQATGQGMPDTLAYWTDEQVDGRNADLRITPERKEKILSDMAQMTERIDRFRYEQTLTASAKERLTDAVMGDIHRRDALGDAGWAEMRESRLATPCEGFSSFRLGHATLIEMIGCDYDGCANEETRQGNPEALASLAKELAEMAAFAYANIPSRYYPLSMGDGCWTTDDVTAHTKGRGRLRVPLDSLGLDESEIRVDGDSWDVSETAQLLAAEWWGMFLTLRAQEIADGRLVPLPARFPGEVLERGEIGVTKRADDRIGMDGGVMLACADVLRYWESVRNGVSQLVEDGNSPALCDIVDGIIERVTSDTLVLGWDGVR